MAEKVVKFEQWVPMKLESVFEFFSNVQNLEFITPPWLNFRVLDTSTSAVTQGTLINYRLMLHGIPLKWRTLIEEWQPNRCFVDTQLKGPFKLWHHTHEFQSRDNGTLMVDTVRYELPFGGLGDMFGGWMVNRDVKGIFEYRKQIIANKFAR